MYICNVYGTVLCLEFVEDQQQMSKAQCTVEAGNT